MNKDTLRKTIAASAAVAKDWFFEHATIKKHDDWDKRGKLEDKGIGVVYAFINAKGKCLYVGQTTGTLKQRANARTSLHYQAVWWQEWRWLRFMNISNQTDQLILEALLILALSPQCNIKPAARRIRQMF